MENNEGLRESLFKDFSVCCIHF